MCSVYYLTFDCGCSIKQEGIVYCAARGTPQCRGLLNHEQRKMGYKCPKHGG